jgi:hypothetical protein
VMPDRAALVERAALLARLARTLRRCLVVMAEPAVMLAQQVRARWVWAAWMEHRRRVTAELVALVELAARVAMLVPAALGAVVVAGLAAAVVWGRRASAALVAVAAPEALAGMRAVWWTAQLVVMLALVAPVAAAALRARLARTPRPWPAVTAGPAATPDSLVVALRVWQARLALRAAAVVAPAALAVLVERAAILVLAARAALVVPGLASAAVWVRRASAALVAVAALAALAGMRAAWPTGRLVVMPDRAALVERAVQLARLARTRRRCLVGLAASAVTLA